MTLDADHDLVISAAEIADAPAALRSLDRNHDGKFANSAAIRCAPTPY